MKKIILSVAALTIAMMSYGQEQAKECCTNTILETVQSVYDYEGLVMEQEHLKKVHYLLEELNDAVRMDLFYSKFSEKNKARMDAFTSIFLFFYLV